MVYAERTEVALEKSIAEIVQHLKRAGAQRIAQVDDVDGYVIQFFMKDRMLRFGVAFPNLDQMPVRDGRGAILSRDQRQSRQEQARRQRGRALMLVIKAKLESVESGVETFEQAFLANVVMADGKTVYDRIAAPIADEYATGAPGLLMLKGPA